MNCNKLRKILLQCSREMTYEELDFLLVECSGYQLAKKTPWGFVYECQARQRGPITVSNNKSFTIQYLSQIAMLIFHD
ncbi:hypothetical protein Lepto7375DRAFT_0950 [Leptolyngbya sp. PCC 7375]|nr:hypothetical protein Lepto7375DRAFT_0950 [Leptolyngbya sp. PCC 7375]